MRIEEESTEEVIVSVAGLTQGVMCDISVFRGKERVYQGGGTYPLGSSPSP